MKTLTATALLAISLASCSALHAATFSAGFDFAGDVPAEQTGMKVYPGATPLRNKNDESESANLQFSFGDYGLKVVAAKLRSADAPDKVAQFYREDLARFGTVLDCTAAETPPTPAPKAKKSKVLTCDGDKPRRNGVLFKVGTRDDQRLAEVHADGSGSRISLVHVKMRNLD